VSYPLQTPAVGRTFLGKDLDVSRPEHSAVRRAGRAAPTTAAAPGRATDPVEAAAFRVPPQPAGVVRRARLETLLDAGARSLLTLVSAPAGTGKTVLVSSWASGLRTGRSVVWVSLRDATIGPRAF